MLEHTTNRQLGTWRRVVELVGADSTDHDGEQGAELVELVEYFHVSSLAQRSSIVDLATLGNGEFSRLPVASQLDELGYAARGCVGPTGWVHLATVTFAGPAGIG